MVSLGAVLGVVWVVQRRLARGAKKERPQDAVRVLAKRGIGPKAQLVVVEVDGIRYVLGVAEGGISVLDRLEPEAQTASVAPLTALPTPAATTSTPAAPPEPADALPLRRRTHQQSRAAARAMRATPLSTFLQKDAAQVLRRALGA